MNDDSPPIPAWGRSICGLGERLKAFRLSLWANQRTFAHILGTIEAEIGRFEADEAVPDARHLSALADLGCDIYWLLAGETAPKAPMRTAVVTAPAEANPGQVVELAEAIERVYAAHGLPVSGIDLVRQAVEGYNLTVEAGASPSEWPVMLRVIAYATDKHLKQARASAPSAGSVSKPSGARRGRPRKL